MAKFSGLRDLKKEREEQVTEPTVSTPQEQSDAASVAPVVQEQRSVSTRVGKRDNPAYVQRTAYIRKKTDQAVKMKLLQQGEGKEFSELVDELLSKWLREAS